MNIFARKIHFYYRHKEWADAIFDRLNGDDEGEIWAARRSAGEIVYKDGTVVRFIPATSQARGYRCNLAYIEASYVGGLDWIFCSTIVMPKMLGEWRNAGPGQVYALSDVKALMRDPDSTGFCIPAKEYFRAQEDMIDKGVKAIDERIKKECEIASVNDAIGTQIKLSKLEAISKLGDWAAENPETADYLKIYDKEYRKEKAAKAKEAIAKLGKWAEENPEAAECMRRYVDTDDEIEESIDNTLKEIKKKKLACTFFHGSLEELEKAAHNGDIIQQDDCGIWWLKRIEDDCK